jgi:hypothetical protein
LKRLKEEDPDLFNLKKYGLKKQYSVYCQKKHQPILYTAEEAKNVKKPLFKYWNMTTNTVAYYECPHKEYKHLGFITGIHPKNYCIPCCRKMESDEADECFKQHVLEKSKKETSYILSYNKGSVGRTTELPPIISKLIPNHFIFLVDQNYKNVSAGILYCVEKMFKISIKDQIKRIIAIGQDFFENTCHDISYDEFLSILRGSISSYDDINDILVNYCSIFDIDVVQFTTTDLLLTDALYYKINTNKVLNMMIVIKDENGINPVCGVDGGLVSADRSIPLYDLFKSYKIDIMDRIFIDKFSRLYGYNIIHEYINLNSYIYAVLLERGNKKVYVPIVYTKILKNADRGVICRKDIELNYADCIKCISELHKFISNIYSAVNMINIQNQFHQQ